MKAGFLTATAWLIAGSLAFGAPAPDSQRLARAKDFIAEEHWPQAIRELQGAVDDAKEMNRDEALFWLAHSEHEFGDQAAAVQAIARLEKEFPSSRWVRPARSLGIEIAQRLRRDDLLWVVAATPRPPLPPAPPPPTTLLAPRPPVPPSTLAPLGFAALPPMPPDMDLRIEALGGLIDAHADRVIPLLRDIALDPHQPTAARRAVFLLAQCPRPEARNIVVEVAKKGAEPARVVAIRELAHFQGAAVSAELMQIATDESDLIVRNTAIGALGRMAPRERLRTLYVKSRPDSRAAVINALFAARDEDGLINIARTEKDMLLRSRARQQLRLLGTPKAIAFLNEQPR
jgi:HEAT repeat protein